MTEETTEEAEAPEPRRPLYRGVWSEGTVMELRIFGDRVRQCRVVLGLRMVDLAAEAEVSEWAVRHVERGDSMDWDSCVRIAHALGMRVWPLFLPKSRWVRFFENYSATVQPFTVIEDESQS